MEVWDLTIASAPQIQAAPRIARHQEQPLAQIPNLGLPGVTYSEVPAPSTAHSCSVR